MSMTIETIAYRVDLALRLDCEATPGPWRVETQCDPTQRHVATDKMMICNTLSGNSNAALIAKYRTLCPALAEEVKRLRADLDRHIEAIDDIRHIANQWADQPVGRDLLHVLRRLDEETGP